jgi:hypothetical protein
MTEGCPTCGVALVWMRVKPPASLGFCEGCGAFWMYRPDVDAGDVADCTEAVYALFVESGTAADMTVFRADDVRGRMMRMHTAQRMRADLGGRAHHAS